MLLSENRNYHKDSSPSNNGFLNKRPSFRKTSVRLMLIIWETTFF